MIESILSIFKWIVQGIQDILNLITSIPGYINHIRSLLTYVPGVISGGLFVILAAVVLIKIKRLVLG